MKKYYATYYRHYCHEVETCDSLEEATRFLINGEDYGELSSVCIWDSEGNRYGILSDKGSDFECDYSEPESDKYPTFEEVKEEAARVME